MEQDNRSINLARAVLIILIYTITTAAIIAMYLLYKGEFTDTRYSDWLFNASMVYLALGVLSAYGSFVSGNSYSHKYINSVMLSDNETRRRIDATVLYTSFKFTIQMIAVGVLLILASAIADKLM